MHLVRISVYFGIIASAVLLFTIWIVPDEVSAPVKNPDTVATPKNNVAALDTVVEITHSDEDFTEGKEELPEEGTENYTEEIEDIVPDSRQTQSTNPPRPAVTQTDLDKAATLIRPALVNIVCTAPNSSRIKGTSGSGVIIDGKGIVITNAHVAQYFLLEKHGVTCALRTGSPARITYEAKLLYISPLWLSVNSKTLTQVSPVGTGEHDFAFLAITGSLTRDELPTNFPHIPLDVDVSRSGDPVILGTYAAQFLSAGQIQSSLFPTVVFGSVKNVFTFATSTIDVLALGGSAAAQEGSSGGGVVTATGKLAGIITTSTITGNTSTRNVNALSASYIHRAYTSETGLSLDILLSTSPIEYASVFAEAIPTLASILELD